jgi:hypothetical protein
MKFKQSVYSGAGKWSELREACGQGSLHWGQLLPQLPCRLSSIRFVWKLLWSVQHMEGSVLEESGDDGSSLEVSVAGKV